MSTRKLEIFIAVCQYLNMSKAAQSLFISQSSVSQAITALEKSYNVILFERLNHTLYLTDAGKNLLFLARQVLDSLEQLHSRMHASAGQTALRLGTSATIGNSLIHPLLQAYARQHPDTRITVEMSNSKKLEKKLLTAKLDLAIMQKTKHTPHLEYLPLLTDELIVICRPDHPLAGRQVPLRDLKDEAFITREKGSGTGLLLETAFAEKGLSLQTNWICNEILAVKNAVYHQAGITVISKFLVQEELAARQLATIGLTDQLFTRQFELAYHQDKLQNRPFQEFVAFCTELGDHGFEQLLQSRA